MGHTPADDGREVFGAVLTEPLDGGDFVMRRGREDDLPKIIDLIDDVMRDAADAAGLRPDLARLMTLHGGTLLIADAETDEPLGGIRMFLHGDAVEFGYWLGAECPRAWPRDACSGARLGRDRRASRAVAPRAADDDRQRAERARRGAGGVHASRPGAADRVSRRPDRRDDPLDPGAWAARASVRPCRRGRRGLPSHRRP